MLTLNVGIIICYISNEISVYEIAFEVESNSFRLARALANSNKTKTIILNTEAASSCISLLNDVLIFIFQL